MEFPKPGILPGSSSSSFFLFCDHGHESIYVCILLLVSFETRAIFCSYFTLYAMNEGCCRAITHYWQASPGKKRKFDAFIVQHEMNSWTNFFPNVRPTKQMMIPDSDRTWRIPLNIVVQLNMYKKWSSNSLTNFFIDRTVSLILFNDRTGLSKYLLMMHHLLHIHFLQSLQSIEKINHA